VSPRASCQERWACSLESSPLNAALLLGDEEGEEGALPPAAPPPPVCDGDSEIDVLKAALEVSLSLGPVAQGEHRGDEAIELAEDDDEDEESEIWLGCKGRLGPCDSEGDENDPAAANGALPAMVAWAPKKVHANASPNLGATWRMPSRNRLAIPLSFR